MEDDEGLTSENNVNLILRELSSKFDRLSADVTKIRDETSKLNSSLSKLKTEVEENFAELKRENDKQLAELKAKVTKLEEITERNTFFIQLNKSIEFNNLEQRGFNIEKYIPLKIIPEMNCFTLVENKGNNFRPDFTWKIHGMTVELQKSPIELESEAFEWSGYPGLRARARAKMTTLFGDVHMALCIEENNNNNELEPIELSLIPHVYYVLRDRANEISPKHLCRSNDYLFTSKFDYSLKFSAQTWDRTLLTDSPYNVDGSVVVDIYVEPPSMARRVNSYNGELHWAIDNYEKRKEMSRRNVVWSHESPYFYTGPRGYRVRVCVWIDGWGAHKGLTAQIVFLPGEFDDELASTFPHTTTVTLFSHDTTRPYISETVNEDIPKSKCYPINLCADYDVADVLLNDFIFYKVTIKSAKLK